MPFFDKDNFAVTDWYLSSYYGGIIVRVRRTMSETRLINKNVGITNLRTAARRSHSAGTSIITDHTTVSRTSTLKRTVSDRSQMDGEATSFDHVVDRDRPRRCGADPAGNRRGGGFDSIQGPIRSTVIRSHHRLLMRIADILFARF